MRKVANKQKKQDPFLFVLDSDVQDALYSRVPLHPIYKK